MKYAKLSIKLFSLIGGRLRTKKIEMASLSFFMKLFLLFIVVGSIGYILISDRENTFTVRGETENITIVFSNDNLNQWDLSNATLLLDITAPDDLVSLSIDSFFMPKVDTTARVLIRNQESKPSQLIITLESDGESAGEIETADKVIQLPSYAEITIDVNQSRVLPLDGYIRVGEDVGLGVESLLLSGEVSIVEKQFFRDERYVATEHKLDTGDRVELHNSIETDSLAKAKGFIRMTPSNPLAFTIHGEAKAVKVHRLGSNSYHITPSIWPRITNDPIIAAFSSLLAVIFLLLEFADLIGKLLFSPRTTDEKDDENSTIAKKP